MLNLSAATRVFVANAPVDLRASFNRLFALTQSVLEQDPLSGHWFVFTNRQPVRARRQASAPGSKFFSGTALGCGVAPSGWSAVVSPGSTVPPPAPPGAPRNRSRCWPDWKCVPRPAGDRQQFDRERHSAQCGGQEELAVHRAPEGGLTPVCACLRAARRQVLAQAGSAVIYSVNVSCRRRGIDPWDYLRDVLQRLPGMKQSELPSILPGRWQPAGSR